MMKKLLEEKRKKALEEAKAKKMDAKAVAKILRGSDWGLSEEGGNGEAVAKGDKLIIRDSYWADGKRKEKDMKSEWASNGTYSKHFSKLHGVKFDVVGSKVIARGGRIYGKKSDRGVVELEVKVIPVEKE